jgi:hypothetical protein
MSSELNNQILLAIQKQQIADSLVLHELKGSMEPRVKALETAATRNWWMTYVVTPILMIGHALLRKFGVQV